MYIENWVPQRLAHEGRAGVKAVLPFPRVAPQLIFHHAVLRLAEEAFAVRVNLFGVLTHLVMRSEGRLQTRAGVVARMMWIDPGRIAQRCSDRDFAGNGARRHRDRRADVTRWRDVALIDDAHGIVVAENDLLQRPGNA